MNKMSIMSLPAMPTTEYKEAMRLVISTFHATVAATSRAANGLFLGYAHPIAGVFDVVSVGSGPWFPE